MGYRTSIALTCEIAEYHGGPECGYIVEHLGVLVEGGVMTTRLLCGGHALGLYGKTVWNQEAILFPLAGDSPQYPIKEG